VEYDAGPRHRAIVGYRPPRRRRESTRFPVTRLRYTPATRTWPLYRRDRHLRFHLSDELTPSPAIGDLRREIDRDPVTIFWG
jgi:hypothetical protein